MKNKILNKENFQELLTPIIPQMPEEILDLYNVHLEFINEFGFDKLGIEFDEDIIVIEDWLKKANIPINQPITAIGEEEIDYIKRYNLNPDNDRIGQQIAIIQYFHNTLGLPAEKAPEFKRKYIKTLIENIEPNYSYSSIYNLLERVLLVDLKG